MTLRLANLQWRLRCLTTVLHPLRGANAHAVASSISDPGPALLGDQYEAHMQVLFSGGNPAVRVESQD